jgi:ribonuclease P protein component
MRVPTAYFLAFCLRRNEETGPRVGLTAPRALGNAVVRNRIKRRMREAVRQRLWSLGPQWDVVFNPRSSVLDAPMPELLREVDKVFRRCKVS